jgi:hypothetical protein
MRSVVQLVMLGMICLLTGCSKPTVTVQVLSNGKLITYVPKGTTVNWVNENNVPVNVNFPYANPCGSRPTQASCVVASGKAIYDCQNNACEDPGIGVQPTTGNGQGTIGRKLKNVQGTSALYQVFCDANGNATADGPDVHQNDHVSWVADTNTAYTLSGFNPAVCDPTTITPGVACQVTMNTTVDATYQVTYGACKVTQGTGKLHVKMQ